ncbi:hypothetical protein [Dictyobacter formicarum]|uniref:Uncharacterized protein n=1 Tax=Dictyobacter formicarum TaxID=2778368 RepID=A0ABQ3VAA7_9CHLR|nr:hypothetical protein [Dictyobacter formicarum]GHO83075.1 hypothetical protein KSZ_10810 [Dictyobacter formicarum]
MQQLVKSQKTGGNTQIQTIMITAITLFALSGAILGFAVGAFTHPHSAQPVTNTSGNNKKPTQVVVSKTPTATPTAATAQALPLGCPGIGTGYNLDGSITITLIAKHKVAGQCDLNAEKNITSDGITCRIILTKAKDGLPVIDDTDRALFKDTANYSGTFPHEITPGLVISNGAPLTQPCVQGQAAWTLTLSPTLEKGNYYIVGLTGNGTYFNYSWSTQLQKK